MMPSLGTDLRAARLARGIGLEVVARDLRINIAFLQAFEHDDFEVSVNDSYTAGFLRSYAKYLGLDGDEIVERFKALDRAQRDAVYDFSELDSNSGGSTTPIWVSGVLTVFIVVFVWIYTIGPDKKPGASRQSQEAVLSEEKSSVVPSSSPAVSGAQFERAPNAAQMKASNSATVPPMSVEAREEALGGDIGVTETPRNIALDRIVLRAKRETWLRISDDTDRVIFSSIVDAGTEYALDAASDLYYIATRDAGAIEVVRNGRVVGVLGRDAENIVNSPFDRTRFQLRP